MQDKFLVSNLPKYPALTAATGVNEKRNINAIRPSQKNLDEISESFNCTENNLEEN